MVVIRGPRHLGGQPMLHLMSRKPDFGVLVVATTDESHGIQIEALAASASPCLWELLRTFLKAPTVPCGPVPSSMLRDLTAYYIFAHRAFVSEPPQNPIPHPPSPEICGFRTCEEAILT